MTRDFIVGVLFLAAIFILGAITILVRGVPFGGQEHNLVVHFDNVAGLNTGDTVRIRGYKSGEVTEIKLDDQSGSVVVNLRLYVEGSPRIGYLFQVQQVSMLVAYTKGSGDLIPASETLRGESGGDLFSSVGDLLSDNRDNVTYALEHLASLLIKMDTGEGLVSDIFNDPQIGENFAQTFADLRIFADDLARGEGLAGALFSDENLKAEFKKILLDVGHQLDDIRAGRGTVGMVFNDEEFRSKVEKIVNDVDKITASFEDNEGLVGLLIHNKEVAKNFEEASRKIDRILSDIDEGKGIIGRLASDEILADAFAKAITDSGMITARIQEGPGSLHNIIYSTDLYQEARDTLTLVRDSTEDVREQEPISAFFSILFSPF